MTTRNPDDDFDTYIIGPRSIKDDKNIKILPIDARSLPAEVGLVAELVFTHLLADKDDFENVVRKIINHGPNLTAIIITILSSILNQTLFDQDLEKEEAIEYLLEMMERMYGGNNG